MFAFGADTGGLALSQPLFGVYWKKSDEIHRTGMTEAEARGWIDECVEVFDKPREAVQEMFGVCRMTWEKVD